MENNLKQQRFDKFHNLIKSKQFDFHQVIQKIIQDKQKSYVPSRKFYFLIDFIVSTFSPVETPEKLKFESDMFDEETYYYEGYYFQNVYGQGVITHIYDQNLKHILTW